MKSKENGVVFQKVHISCNVAKPCWRDICSNMHVLFVVMRIMKCELVVNTVFVDLKGRC